MSHITRRQLVVASLGGAAATAVGVNSLAKAAAASEQIQVALIGVRGMGRAVSHDILDFSARVVATVVARPSATPHLGGLSDGFGVSGCRFEAQVAVFPSRRPRRAQVGG